MRILLLALVCFAGLANQASASMLTLNSGNLWGSSSAVGGGRGTGILANSSFSISSLGIFGNLNAQSFDAQIYSSTNGSDAGSLLASASAVLGGTGTGWHDINLNFNFSAGQYYVLHWRPTTPNFNGWGTIDYYQDSALPTTIGPLTLVDGVQGYDQNSFNFNNTLHPNLRINTGANVVPEPASLALWSVGLVGLAFTRRRSR